MVDGSNGSPQPTTIAVSSAAWSVAGAKRGGAQRSALDGRGRSGATMNRGRRLRARGPANNIIDETDAHTAGWSIRWTRQRSMRALRQQACAIRKFPRDLHDFLSFWVLRLCSFCDWKSYFLRRKPQNFLRGGSAPAPPAPRRGGLKCQNAPLLRTRDPS